MAVRRLASKEMQPADFSFNKENLAWAHAQMKKFPEGRQASAVIPLLWRAQEQHGWLPEPAIRHVGELLDMPYIRVLEVATFYTMFNLEPVGRFFVQLCGTTPCMLRGAEDLKQICREEIGEQNQITKDGMLSWLEVECLGACVNAPMVQINKDYYEDLTPARFREILQSLRKGEHVEPGPQIDRQFSAPQGGVTTLKAYVSEVQSKRSSSQAVKAASHKKKTETKAEAELPLEDMAVKPELLKAPKGGKADNLKKLTGVGPKMEATLHEAGIFHFAQIASWSTEEMRWVDGEINAKGRIERDDWVAQAKKLMSE